MIDLRLYTSPVMEKKSVDGAKGDPDINRYLGVCFSALRDIQTHVQNNVPTNFSPVFSPALTNRLKIVTKTNTVNLTILTNKEVTIFHFEDPFDVTGSSISVGMVDGRIYNVVKLYGKYINDKGSYSFQQSSTLFSTYYAVVKNPKPFEFTNLLNKVLSVEIISS